MPRRELESRLRGRVVVVGVGDSRHGDDGVGPLVVEILESADFKGAIDSGASPELDTWKLREMKPDTVLFVDAADFGGEPGDVSILDTESLRTEGYDTHRTPLKLTMEYLEQELDCKCLLLAAQPKDVRQGAAMCEDVRRAAETVAHILNDLLSAGHSPANTDGEGCQECMKAQG